MRNATPIQPEWRGTRLRCGVSRLRAAQASEVCDDRPHSNGKQSCHRHHLPSPEELRTAIVYIRATSLSRANSNLM
jgi:hypothetical protein